MWSERAPSQCFCSSPRNLPFLMCAAPLSHTRALRGGATWAPSHHPQVLEEQRTDSEETHLSAGPPSHPGNGALVRHHCLLNPAACHDLPPSLPAGGRGSVVSCPPRGAPALERLGRRVHAPHWPPSLHLRVCTPASVRTHRTPHCSASLRVK